MTTDDGHFNQMYNGSPFNIRNIFDEVWITGKTRSLILI